MYASDISTALTTMLLLVPGFAIWLFLTTPQHWHDFAHLYANLCTHTHSSTHKWAHADKMSIPLHLHSILSHRRADTT